LKNKSRVLLFTNNFIILVLNHEEDSEYIMTDDELDHIQWDLEAMLTSLIIRKNTIKDELATFASMQFTRSLNRTAKNPKLPTIVSFDNRVKLYLYILFYSKKNNLIKYCYFDLVNYYTMFILMNRERILIEINIFM
jgi:hypothetical protein